MLFINTDTVDLGFTFVAIRKNATTSIGNAIYSFKNNIDYDNSLFPKNIHQSGIFLYDSDVSLEKTIKFTCIRDPFERLASAFMNKVVQYSPDKNSDYCEIEQYNKAYPDHQKFLGDTEKYFDHFLSFLEGFDLSEIDHHFALQYDCARFDSIDYDLVINQSHLYKDWEMVKTLIPGMPDLPKEKMNKTNSKDLSSHLFPMFENRVRSLYHKDYSFMEDRAMPI